MKKYKLIAEIIEKKSVYKLVYHVMPFMNRIFFPSTELKRCNFNKHTKSIFTTFEA